MSSARSKTVYGKYHSHKSNAKGRGIEWLFTLNSWVSWWEANLGPNWMRLRGCRRGQYVMARFGDTGPYAEWNIACILQEENHKQFNKERRRTDNKYRTRLSAFVVRRIYLDERDNRSIADAFGLDWHQVYCIKKKIYYRAVTKDLT